MKTGGPREGPGHLQTKVWVPWLRLAETTLRIGYPLAQQPILELFHRYSVRRVHQVLTLRLDLFAQQSKFLPSVQFCDQHKSLMGSGCWQLPE